MTSNRPNEATIFNTARAIVATDERRAFLDETCGTDVELRERVEKLLAAYAEESRFLEQPAAELEATIIPEAMNDARAESLRAGLAAAFREGEAVVVGSAGHSVLKMLGQSIDKVPRVALRDSVEEKAEPIARPSSPEMPQRDSDSRYQLQGEIARGGMGAILKGRDTDLGRDLAIKVLLDQHKDKPEVIQRFVEEAQIGGQLQHPGIAPIYELGQFSDKRPFFAMKLVKGQTLSKLLADREAAAEDRGKFIGIFEQVCQTVAYAHSRGVIHRDLKPANIMVGAFGEVQVMDWGLAKVLPAGGVADEKKSQIKQSGQSIIATLRSGVGSDSPGAIGSVGSQTQMGSVMGTPAYMPPEQALGEIDHLDERADVFGLGAILCEILTGKPPYVADDGTRVFRMASRGKLEDCFQRLDACGADEDLLALTKHCLELEPVDRPRDAGMLAERVTEYLESVETRLREVEMKRAAEAARAEEALHTIAEAEARTRAERRAKRLQLTMAGVVAVLATIGGLAAVWTATEQARLKNDALLAERDANTAREREAGQRAVAEAAKTRAEAEESRAKTEQSRAKTEQLRAEAAQRLAEDREKALRTTLYAAEMNLAGQAAEDPSGLRRVGQITENWTTDETAQDVRGWEWYYLSSLRTGERLSVSSPGAVSVAWTSDGKRFFGGDRDGVIRLYGSATGELLLELRGHTDQLQGLALSPDGSQLASASRDKTIRLWDVKTGQPVAVLTGHTHFAHGVGWSPDGKQLASTASDNTGELFIWDITTGQPVVRITSPGMESRVAWHPHLPQVSTVHGVYHATSGEKLWSHSGWQTSWSPTGDRLAVIENQASIVSAKDGTTLVELVGATGGHRAVDWNTDGTLLAISSNDNTVTVWEAASGQQLSVLRGHTDWVVDAKWSPDGKQLVSAGNGTFKLWDWPQRGNPEVLKIATRTPRTIVWDESGTALNVCGHDGLVACDLGSNETRQLIGPEMLGGSSMFSPAMDWHPASHRIVVKGLGAIAIYDAQTMQVQLEIPDVDEETRSLDLSPDGTRLVTSAWQGPSPGDTLLRAFNTVTGAELWTQALHPHVAGSVRWSPDGKRIACAGWGQGVVVDADSGQVLTEIIGNHEYMWINAIDWEPSGHRIAWACMDRTIHIFDTESGKEQLAFSGHTDNVLSVSWSSDGRRIASSGNDRTIRIWDVETGNQLLVLRGQSHPVTTVAWSPDGLRLAAGTDDGQITIWDALPGYARAGSAVVLARLNRRLEENPGNVADLRQRLHIHERLGQHEAAEQDRQLIRQIYQEQWQADPTNLDVADGLASILLATRSQEQWTTLTPTQLSAATNGATLTRLDDGSMIAAGNDLLGDVYSLTVSSDVRQLAAIRLEVLPDRSLPNNGPGRHVSGNFHLAKFRAFRVSNGDGLATGEPIPFSNVIASFAYSASNADVTGTIRDGHGPVWHVWGQTGREHHADFFLKEPLELRDGESLRFELAHPTTGDVVNLGRFRVKGRAGASLALHHQLRAAIEQRAFTGILRLAAVQLSVGEPQQALATLDASENDSPGTVCLLRAICQHDLKQANEARATVEQLDVLLHDQQFPLDLQPLVTEVLTTIGNRIPASIALLFSQRAINLELARLTAEAEADPQSSRKAHNRGQFLARLGRWRDCADNNLRVTRVQPKSRFSWSYAASPLLLDGDTERYRQLCRAMVEQFAGTTEADVADTVCKISLLLPDTIELTALPVDTLRAGISDPRWEAYRPWFLGCSALISYRAGEFEEAIRSATQVTPANSQPGALAHVVRTMSEERLGHHDEAVRLLTEVEESIPSELRTLGTPLFTESLPVNKVTVGHDWLIPEILRREAAALIRPPHLRGR